MDIDPKYTFVPLLEKNHAGINDSSTEDLFAKWGLNFSIQEYLFNEPFHQYHKYQLVEAFFKDGNVAKTLNIYQGHSWLPRGIPATSVVAKQVPCSVLNMSFFDKLKNPENNIIHDTGTICKRCDIDIDGIFVSDNLRGVHRRFKKVYKCFGVFQGGMHVAPSKNRIFMLLDEESNEYHLYGDLEREEFIFRIFQMLVLGGELCQYEDELEPYLACTKKFYKDLIRVQKSENSEDYAVSTTVMEVIAKDDKDIAFYPCNNSHQQNNAFLLIYGDLRLIKAITHQSSGYFA